MGGCLQFGLKNKNSRRFIILRRRTTTPHSSFLTPHFLISASISFLHHPYIGAALLIVVDAQNFRREGRKFFPVVFEKVEVG